MVSDMRFPIEARGDPFLVDDAIALVSVAVVHGGHVDGPASPLIHEAGIKSTAQT